MTERISAHVVLTGKEIDRLGQELTAASNSLLAGIEEHREQTEVTIHNLSQEISKLKVYTKSKFREF
jgi:hypothetical protein